MATPDSLTRAMATMVLLLTLTAPTLGQERSSPLPSHLPLETEACFGRSYDGKHLAQHPKQRVTSFHLAREFSQDGNAETPPTSPEELRASDGSDGRVNVSAYVRFRDRKGVFWNALSCSQGEEGTVFCGIDCDGGSFKLRPSGGALLLQNEGFVVVGGCGASEEEQEKPEYVRPGADDRVFRLEPRPIAECAAERDALRPAWAKLGRPLRVRFDKTEAVCFTRNYDAAFLAAHPQQMVRRAAVLKDHGVRTEDAGFPRFRLTFRVELRDGRKAERVAECAADNYALSCSVAGDPEVQEAFHLTRAREQGMMLRDRRGKLPKFFKARLGTDDRLFKLQADVPGGCDF